MERFFDLLGRLTAATYWIFDHTLDKTLNSFINLTSDHDDDKRWYA